MEKNYQFDPIITVLPDRGLKFDQCFNSNKFMAIYRESENILAYMVLSQKNDERKNKCIQTARKKINLLQILKENDIIAYDINKIICDSNLTVQFIYSKYILFYNSSLWPYIVCPFNEESWECLCTF